MNSCNGLPSALWQSQWLLSCMSFIAESNQGETMTTIEIDRAVAAKVLATVDAGLSSGIGDPVPGRMCVEAAVCYALGLPHGDNPQCVSPALRTIKIRLNDANWSSNTARAKGLRRLALAQLGSVGVLDEKEFSRRVVDHAIRVSVPEAMRVAASIIKNPDHKAAMIAAAARCEKEGTREAAIAAKKTAAAAADAAADAAYAYAYADAAARDKSLANYAEAVVQILIEMKAPGCQWLDLTEETT